MKRIEAPELFPQPGSLQTQEVHGLEFYRLLERVKDEGGTIETVSRGKRNADWVVSWRVSVPPNK